MRISMVSLLTRAAILAVPLTMSAPAWAAKCVQMIFIDAKGAVFQAPTPIVGLLLAGQPVITVAAPQGYDRKVGPPVACPAALVKEVQDLFNQSCLSEERRRKATTDNGVGIDVINKRCGDMAEALAAKD
jgi:hypothetical protein